MNDDPFTLQGPASPGLSRSCFRIARRTRHASRRFFGEAVPSASSPERSFPACSRISEHSIRSVRSWNQASINSSTSELAFRPGRFPEKPIGHDAPSWAAADQRSSNRQFDIAQAPSPTIPGNVSSPGRSVRSHDLPRATSPIRGVRNPERGEMIRIGLERTPKPAGIHGSEARLPCVRLFHRTRGG